MARSDSLFRFEIFIEKLKSYVNEKQFIIKSQFADVFSLVLRENTMSEVPSKALTGQSVFTSNIDELISYMMQYPIEITFWNKKEPDSRIGSTVIPWNPAFVQFLARLYKGEVPRPVVVTDTRNVFDELTSKRMAIIKLVIKMSHVSENAALRLKGNLGLEKKPEKKPNTLVYPSTLKKSNTLNTEKKPLNTRNGSSMIKTIYSAKRKHKRHSKTKKRTEREDLSTGIGHSNVKEVEHSDVKEIEYSDVKEIEHSDVKEIEHSNAKEIEHTDVKEIEHSAVKEIEHSDVKEIEHNNVTQMKHSYVKEIKSEIAIGKSLLILIRSDTNIDRNAPLSVAQIKSCSSIKPPNILNYIFNDQAGRFRNKVYTVGYFTVESIPSNSSKEKESNESLSASKSVILEASSKGSKTKAEATGKGSKTEPDSTKSKSEQTFTLCSADCPAKKKTLHAESECRQDFPEAASKSISLTNCEDLRCFNRKEIPRTDVASKETMLERLELPSRMNPCCVETVQEQVIDMKGHMTVGDQSCGCTCDCIIYGKRTTYCRVCGGYEDIGDDTEGRPHYLMPPPCPIYHKIEKKRSSKSSSRSRKKKQRPKTGFKHNYGYKAPQMGHSRCVELCTGDMNVPKSMGWLWNADNVPGLPLRPHYKPGAVSKFVFNLLKQARKPAKPIYRPIKRKVEPVPRVIEVKRPLKRPLLIVHKKDCEYSVTMETMKTYTRRRALNQPPYEDKDPIKFTVERTEEENLERMRKRERAQRRLEREQRDFIQSSFKDMCKDICLKTHQQVLGIGPDTETTECVCYPALPGPDHTNMDRSCSCSEDHASLFSETDSDEWIVQFTPPIARFDPKYKPQRVRKSTRGTQYTYLDYRVKLLDFSGHEVPRCFKDCEDNVQCSDLGGFWSPNHEWLEINVDGYIAPDGRWAPNIFIGPNGELVDAERGKFQTHDKKWLTVGVDGYIDCQNKWKYYAKRSKPSKKTAKFGQSSAKRGGGVDPKSQQSWSCLGDVSPAELSKLGIIGHGVDKRMLYEALLELMAGGRRDVMLPDLMQGHPPKSDKKGKRPSFYATTEQVRCRHAPPSDKGIVIDKKGHKSYFKAHGWKNPRPRDRMVQLQRQGRSLSSFHKPCFHSFINHDSMMAQKRERLMRRVAEQITPNKDKGIAVQSSYIM